MTRSTMYPGKAWHTTFDPFTGDIISVDRLHDRSFPPPPPKPKAPTGSELLQSYSTTHRVRVVSSGVKFKTREHLMIGLDYLAGRNVDSAYGHTLQALGDNDPSGMGVVLFAMMQPNKEDWYEKHIRKPIEAFQLPEEISNDCVVMLREDWDYDGPGPWHKANLRVWADAEGFYLHHYAAYVGNKPETRMAAALPEIATLNILTYHHHLTYETHSDRWAIPLSDLRAVYARVNREFDAEAFLYELTHPVNPEEKQGRSADVTGPVIVNPDDNNISCSIQLGYRSIYASQHDRDPVTNEPLEHHAYRIEGEFLTGPSRERSDSFQDDWRPAMNLDVYLKPQRPYDNKLVDEIQVSSELLTRDLQKLQERPDPYLNG